MEYPFSLKPTNGVFMLGRKGDQPLRFPDPASATMERVGALDNVGPQEDRLHVRKAR